MGAEDDGVDGAGAMDPVSALISLGFAGLILGWLWIIRIGRDSSE